MDTTALGAPAGSGAIQGDGLHMVARKEGAESSHDTLSRRVFEAWRRLLTRILKPTRDVLFHSGDHRKLSSNTRDGWMLGIGLSCLLIGGLARFLVADAGPRAALAAIAALTSILLAVGRYALLILVASRRGVAARDVRYAWSSGLIPWIAAVDPVLASLAWAVSGALTYRVLVGRAAPVAIARRAVVIAWGAHALLALIAWLTRNAWVAVLLSG